MSIKGLTFFFSILKNLCQSRVSLFFFPFWRTYVNQGSCSTSVYLSFGSCFTLTSSRVLLVSLLLSFGSCFTLTSSRVLLVSLLRSIGSCFTHFFPLKNLCQSRVLFHFSRSPSIYRVLFHSLFFIEELMSIKGPIPL